MPPGYAPLPKMMIGFVVRRCAVELGHPPSAAEFAAWANACETESGPCCLFGRPISDAEAAVILKSQSRLVTAKSASAEEAFVEEGAVPAQPTRPTNLVSLAEVRSRRASLRRRR